MQQQSVTRHQLRNYESDIRCHHKHSGVIAKKMKIKRDEFPMGFKPTTRDKRVETLRYFSLPLTNFTPTSAILPRPSPRPLYRFVTSFMHYLPTGANLWPAILSEPRDVTVTPSSGGPPTFTILCIKSPGTTVTWFRNGKLVDISRNRQDLKVSSDGSLHITNALKGRDEGSYQCLVSNRNGAVLSSKATVKFACK